MDILAQIEQAKKDILSEDGAIRLPARDFLSENANDDAKSFLISLLDSEEGHIRNVSALAIREIGDNNAVEPLVKAIFKPENKHNNGTLVYALQTLDCSRLLKQLFKIIFYHDYEPQVMATMILDEQEFVLKRQDILDIQAEWEALKTHTEKSDDEKQYIQDYVDGFLPYLEEQ